MISRWGAVRRCGVAAATGLAVLVAGCAEPEERSLCTVYDRFVDAAASLDDVSIDGSTAGEAAERVEEVRARVRNLDAVADTRYDAQLDQLEDSLDNLLRTLESIPDDADAATWEPLVEDSAENARHEALVVIERIGASCEPVDVD